MTTTPTFWSNGTITFSNDIFAFNPKVAALADDSFVIVWEDGNDLFGRHLDPLGSFTSGNFLSSLSGATTKDLFNPVIFQQDNGAVVVEYGLVFSQTMLPPTIDRDVRWHLLNSDFSPNASSFGIEVSSADEIFLAATARSDGAGDFGSAVAYRYNVGPTDSVVLRFVDPLGNQASNQIFVAEADPGALLPPSLASRHTGHVVIAYTKKTGGIGFHIYAKNGSDLTGEVVVSNTGSFPNVAALDGPSTGIHVVAWQDAGGIMFKRYSAGVALDSNPVAIANSGGLLPHVAPLKDGGFLIVWGQAFGTESDGSADFDLAIQRFAADGSPVGDRVFIDQPGDQGPFAVNVATLADGRVVIVFNNETGDATNLTKLDYAILDPRDPLILGTNGNDTIVSRIEGAKILGLDGDDTLIGMNAKDVLKGGNGNDNLSGGLGNDRLVGGPGNDVLFGVNGKDKLLGGPGDDVLNGGKGPDKLKGGPGSNVYVFTDVKDSKPGKPDKIVKFLRGADTIDLSEIDAIPGGTHDPFKFIGKKGFSGEAGELHYVKNGGSVLVEGDVKGNGKADFRIEVTKVSKLSANDFDLDL